MGKGKGKHIVQIQRFRPFVNFVEFLGVRLGRLRLYLFKLNSRMTAKFFLKTPLGREASSRLMFYRQYSILCKLVSYMGFLHVSSLNRNHPTAHILFNRPCEYARNLFNHNYKFARHPLYNFNNYLTYNTLHALQNFRHNRSTNFLYFNKFKFRSSLVCDPILPFCIHIPSRYTTYPLLLFFLQQVGTKRVLHICCLHTRIGSRSLFNNLALFVFYVLRGFITTVLFYPVPLRKNTQSRRGSLFNVFLNTVWCNVIDF